MLHKKWKYSSQRMIDLFKIGLVVFESKDQLSFIFLCQGIECFLFFLSNTDVLFYHNKVCLPFSIKERQLSLVLNFLQWLWVRPSIICLRSEVSTKLIDHGRQWAPRNRRLGSNNLYFNDLWLAEHRSSLADYKRNADLEYSKIFSFC